MELQYKLDNQLYLQYLKIKEILLNINENSLKIKFVCKNRIYINLTFFSIFVFCNPSFSTCYFITFIFSVYTIIILFNSLFLLLIK